MTEDNMTTNDADAAPRPPRPRKPNLPRTPAEIKAQRNAANAKREQAKRNERALRGVVAAATYTNTVSDPSRPMKARG